MRVGILGDGSLYLSLLQKSVINVKNQYENKELEFFQYHVFHKFLDFTSAGDSELVSLVSTLASSPTFLETELSGVETERTERRALDIDGDRLVCKEKTT